MALEHTLDTPLSKAVVAARSQSAFARIIGRSQSYVHGLMRDGKGLTIQEAALVEAAKIGSMRELCPEVFAAVESAATLAPKSSDPDFEHAS